MDFLMRKVGQRCLLFSLFSEPCMGHLCSKGERGRLSVALARY